MSHDIEHTRRRFLAQATMIAASVTSCARAQKGHAVGAPHPDPDSYAKKFSGRYAYRSVAEGIGHNRAIAAVDIARIRTVVALLPGAFATPRSAPKVWRSYDLAHDSKLLNHLNRGDKI